jgi:hypothetical protein
MLYRCARGAYTRNEEPSLDDLLAEPAIRLMMRRDGVDEKAIRRLAAWVRACCNRRREQQRAEEG